MTDYSAIDKSNWYGYFPYKPSYAAAIVFFILYLFLLILDIIDMVLFKHTYGKKYTYQSLDSIENQHDDVKYEMRKSKRFVLFTQIPLIIGIVFEFGSYILRALSIKNPDTLIFYVISQALVLVGPSATAGAIYMIFGRLKNFLDADKYALIRSRFFTAIMVSIDVLCALMQASGSYMMTTVDKANTGFNMAIGAFAGQIFLFSLFILIAIRFLILLNKNPTSSSRFIDQGSLTNKAPNWRLILWTLLISMSIIVLRCVLRLIEFLQGIEGSFMTHEIAMYFIDSIPIFIATVLLVVMRPMRTLWEMSSYKNWKQNSKESNDPSTVFEQQSAFSEYKQYGNLERTIL